MKIILETKRLILREMGITDYDALKSIISDPVNMKYYPKPYDDEGVNRWLNWCINSYRENGFGLWAVILKDTGKMIGDCGISLQNIDSELKPEIGYHLRLDCHHKGYGIEMVRAVKDYFFYNYNYDEVYSYMNINNEPSKKLAIKNGMEFVKTFQGKNNETDLVYRITRKMWQDSKNKVVNNS